MTHAIVLNSLTKHFGDQRGISNVSFEVTSGTVFGYLGPNGAGKSTTIRLLLGLYRPTSGNARVLGLDPRHGNVELLRRVGYLPGELNLFARLTGREIVDRFASARGLIDHSVRHQLVERFRVELDRPVRTLSKGNRQKIGLVLAFQHPPELLILDEPTSGFDPLLQDEFASLLREIVAEGRTVFLSSHDLDEVQRVVHELAIIKEGRIVVTDTVQGLRSRAARTIELRFPLPPDVEAFRRLPGVEVRSTTDSGVGLALTGPVAPVLELAGRQGALDIIASPPDLDELFLSFYDDDTTREHGMSAEATRLDLRLRRRMAAWSAVGMAAYALLIVALYPAFKDDASLDALTRDSSTLAALFGATGSLTSVEGWLNANLYANFVPLIAFLLTIGYGAAAIAGQDEDGSLGLTATLPLSRSRILAGKAGTLAALACVVPLTTLLCLLPGPRFDLEPDWWAATQTTFAVTLMALDFGLLALAIGAITTSRGAALGVTSAMAALSYLISSLAPVVDWVHAIRHLSLFWWAVGDHQLTDGISLASVTVMAASGGLLLLVARQGFQRMDIH